MTNCSSVSGKDSRLVGFDAEWYLATYPDVALTGMSAEDHYVLCGQLIGRAGHAAQMISARALEGPRIQPREVAARFGRGTPRDMPLSDSAEESPIVAAPADLARSKARAQTGRPLNLGAPQILTAQDELARFRTLGDMAAQSGPVALYCQLLDLPAGSDGPFRIHPGTAATHEVTIANFDTGSCASEVFRDGHARLENIWFSDEATLRVYVRGTAEAALDGSGPDVIRAWIADTEDDGALRLASSTVLPHTGPGFFDIPLLNPLMPVLLELSDATGFTTGFALLAFPSLLRGGLHAVERAAWQQGKNPMDDVWRLSDALLSEFLDGPRETGFAVSDLAIDLAGATGAERLFSSSVRDWLARVFGVEPRAAETGESHRDGTAWLADDLGAGRGRRPQGLTLTLPACGVPSLSALVSRRLALPEGVTRAAGPFLVADSVSLRPLWSVSLPLGPWFTPDMPVLSRAGPQANAPQGPCDDAAIPELSWLAPLHLAVICRSAIPVSDIARLLPVAPDAPVTRSAPAAAISVVVLCGTDSGLVQRALSSLQQQHGITVRDVLIVPALTAQTGDVTAMKTAAEQLFSDRVSMASPMAAAAPDLDRIAALTQADQILIIEENVILHDRRCLSALSDIMAGDAKAGSVSCMLLHEEVQGKSTRIDPASGGLFPAGVSFISAPRLIVIEPDVEAALPQSTYPVVANTLALCLIRRTALDATQTARRTPTGAVVDLQFGLTSFAAGYRSICTSMVRAGITRHASRRDDMDPLGLSCLAPARWDDLLSYITVLRVLR